MADPKTRGLSAADVTRRYIDEHPSVREALRDDLLNYTALARMIGGAADVRNEEAVTIACRRYQRELGRESPADAAVARVIAGSRLQVHSDIALVRIRDDPEVLDRLLGVGRRTLTSLARRPLFEVFEGTRAVTVLCEEPFLATLLAEIPARLRLSVERGLAIVAFRSHDEVASTPGVLAFMAEALFRRGINCLETVSVHRDSIFVFRSEEVIGAYQVLSALIPAGPDPSPEVESPGEHR